LEISPLRCTYARAVALYGLGGWWLDRKLGSEPWLTLLGVAIGAVGGFVWIYREVLHATRQSRDERDGGEGR